MSERDLSSNLTWVLLAIALASFALLLFVPKQPDGLQLAARGRHQ